MHDLINKSDNIPLFQVEKLGSPLDTLSNHLAQILQYEKGERDMLLLRHEVRGAEGVFITLPSIALVHS